MADDSDIDDSDVTSDTSTLFGSAEGWLRATGRAPLAEQLEARWPELAAGGGPKPTRWA